MRLREATSADAAVLVRHRREMMAEILRIRGKDCAEEDLDRMDSAYLPYLVDQMSAGMTRGWVVENTGGVVGSGMVSMLSWPPGLAGGGSIPVLHSVYTEPALRRQGIARQIVERAVEFCRSEKCPWMLLGASDAGRPLYESIGFQPASGMMRLWLG
jgi:GNAT superfamily N-acetyltransferase